MDKCYSTDGENFNFTEASEALQDLNGEGELFEGRTYYESDCEQVSLTRYLSAHQVLEWAEERMADEFGELSEDAFSVDGEATSELDALLAAWAEKHLRGRYWRGVGETREIKVTAGDVAEYAT